MKLIKFSNDKKYILLKQNKGFFEIPFDEICMRGGRKKWLAYLKECDFFTEEHKKALSDFLKHTRITHKKAP